MATTWQRMVFRTGALALCFAAQAGFLSAQTAGPVYAPYAGLGPDGVIRVQAEGTTPPLPSPALGADVAMPAAPGMSAPGLAEETGDLSVPAAERAFGGGEPTLEVAAEEAAEEEEGTLLMSILGMEDSPLQIYGWIQNSFTGNPSQPSNFSNFPVTPNYKANTWMGNQYYLIFEKALDLETDWDWGFRVDNLFGHDWQFNKMYGLFDNAFNPGQFAGYDPAQFYLEAHTPWLTEGGIDWKFGRWYTLHGYEAVPAIARPLLSVPYDFTYGQPFTHTGLMTTWHVTDKLNVYNGTTNGWDRWFNENYRWGYMGGFAWTFGEEDRGNLTMIYSGGPNQYPRDVRPDYPFIFPGTGPGNISYHGINPNYDDNWRHLWTTVGSWQWSDRLTQVMETDQGIDRRVPGLNGIAPNGIPLAKTQSWYNLTNWFLYDLSDKLTFVWRSEVFRDHGGSRLLTYRSDNYYEQTIGLIWKPCPYLWIRPEARYDWSQFHPIFNGGESKSQFTFGLDWIVLF